MEKNLDFGVRNTHVIQKETFGGLMLIVTPRNAAGTLAVIDNLNDIHVEVTLVRGRKKTKIFDDDLGDILYALFGDSKQRLQAITAVSGTYYIMLPHNTVKLSDTDKYEVKIDPEVTSFREATLANSSIIIDTIPASNNIESNILTVETVSLNVGDDEFTERLGNGVLALGFSNNIEDPEERDSVDEFCLKAIGFEKEMDGVKQLAMNNMSQPDLAADGLLVGHQFYRSVSTPLNNVVLDLELNENATNKSTIYVVRGINAKSTVGLQAAR